ncbi:MAG: hypothetical protein Q9174_005396 [Haloplaca sp. 1 TL-2023]
MAGYGWKNYDVREGGTHVVNDTRNKLDLVTHFIRDTDSNHPNQWNLRVVALPRPDAPDSQHSTIFVYLGIEAQESSAECERDNDTGAPKNDVTCRGKVNGLGDLNLHLSDDTAANQPPLTHVTSLTVPVEAVWQAKRILIEQLQNDASPRAQIHDNPGKGNLHFIQKIFHGSCQFDVQFSSGTKPAESKPAALAQRINDVQSAFGSRFASTFSPQPPFQDQRSVDFSQYLVSNLMGGVGFFHGNAKIETSASPPYGETIKAGDPTNVQDKGPYQLLSAVPSRPFFPRGFLWDEGYHLQVMMHWDMDFAMTIVQSWFDLMDDDGWIAREQILGPEARSKVLPEFQTQYPNYANPPTLFLVVEAFVARLEGEVHYRGAPSRLLDQQAGRTVLMELYPKLKKHYEWFRRTQCGGDLTKYGYPDPQVNEGYRWQGRTPQHILTSGLDDYPRAGKPHAGELHVDALAWVGTMAMALDKIAAFLSKKEDRATFHKHTDKIIRSIDSIHWSDSERSYCDTTINGNGQVEKVCHKGYISLFPFTNKLLNSTHPNLGAILDLIQDPEELWSPHGLRSLSQRDHNYGTGENYWRGAVWVNINYMVLERLLDLTKVPGPHRRRARDIYIDLRNNMVNTVFNSWEETGFAWEQYNAETGKGQRTQHFTGWTALVTNIMAMPDLRTPDVVGPPERSKSTTTWPPHLLLLTVIILLVMWYLFRRKLNDAWKLISSRRISDKRPGRID